MMASPILQRIRDKAASTPHGNAAVQRLNVERQAHRAKSALTAHFINTIVDGVADAAGQNQNGQLRLDFSSIPLHLRQDPSLLREAVDDAGKLLAKNGVGIESKVKLTSGPGSLVIDYNLDTRVLGHPGDSTFLENQ